MALEIDQMHARNQCGALIVSIASLTERFALAILNRPESERTFATWRDILNHLEPYEFRSGIDYHKPYSSFLTTIRNGRTDLTGRNRDSFRRFEHAISIILSVYLAPSRTLSDIESGGAAKGHPDENFVLYMVAQFRKLIVADLPTINGPLATFLNGLSTRNTYGLVDQILLQFFPDGKNPRHPIFSAVPLFDPKIVRSEFLFVADLGAHESDPSLRVPLASFQTYAVLREARGWSAPDPREANAIVRDLLWIKRVPSHKIVYSDPQPIIGLYVSVTQGYCYLIEDVEVHGVNIIVRAKDPNVDDVKNRKLVLIFRSSNTSHPLQIRDGMLSGFAGTEGYLGAWKTVMLVPHWPILPQLNAIIEQSTNRNLADIHAACVSCGAAGTVFSTALRAAKPSIQKRREAFRRLAGDDIQGDEENSRRALGDLLAADIRPELRELIADAVEAGVDVSDIDTDRTSAVITDIIFQKLNQVADMKWHLLQPAQIVTLKQLPTATGDSSLSKRWADDIQELLDRNELDTSLFD
jgi:hypothetical protein